jgi:hypothetical protein
MRRPKPDCPACGVNRTITDLEKMDYEAFCDAMLGASGSGSGEEIERISVKVSYG